MDKKLTQKQIIKLIELYRSKELLWNMSISTYRRNDLKIKAIDEIAKEMFLPVDIVKKKLRALRNTYTAERRKMIQAKKSGSASDDMYVPSVFWFNEMRFLDSSINIRKSSDNANHSYENSFDFNEYIEEEFEENAGNYSGVGSSNRPNQQTSKLDEAMGKLISIADKENEFTTFGASVGMQLQKFPEDEAYTLMGDIQNLITQRKIKNVRKPTRFTPTFTKSSLSSSADCTRFAASPSLSPIESTQTSMFAAVECTQSTSTTHKNEHQYATCFTDILSTAISDAEIDFSNS